MDLAPFLLLSIIGVLVGFALGAMIFTQRGGKRGLNLPLPPANPDREDTVRLLRDKRTGIFRVEIDGQIINSAQDLRASQNARLNHAALDLQSWLGASAPGPTPSPVTTPTSVISPAEVVQSPPDTLVKRPSFNPIDILAKALQADVKTPAAAPQSIAAQIDEILQEKLESPEMAGSSLKSKAIRLMELPEKGLVVMVGLDQYDGVESIPDPEIKALIRACVADWEAR